MKLLNSGNAKTIKGEKLGFKTFGIHLSPFNKSGHNACQWASKGCAMACLDTAGMGNFSNVQAARIAKTRLFFEEREKFLAQLRKEIKAAIRNAAKNDLTPCFRLNLTSDIPWEKTGIMAEFPNVQFYDYTKGAARMTAFLSSQNAPKSFGGALLKAAKGGNEWPENYHLTFSRSEKKTDNAKSKVFLASGGNVAVVFRGKLPSTWQGFPVIDGDESDLRFLDKPGHVIGLVEKGLAKKDESGFVLEAH